MRANYAERARALVGTRFRPQGRSAEGLDCVGLVLSTFEIPTDQVRSNYRLRGDHRHEIQFQLNQQFRRVSKNHFRSGDVMLMAVANDQFHLGVATGCGFVHADARIGRVVETPGVPAWRIIGVYRKRARVRNA